MSLKNLNLKFILLKAELDLIELDCWIMISYTLLEFQPSAVGFALRFEHFLHLSPLSTAQELGGAQTIE